MLGAFRSPPDSSAGAGASLAREVLSSKGDRRGGPRELVEPRAARSGRLVITRGRRASTTLARQPPLEVRGLAACRRPVIDALVARSNHERCAGKGRGAPSAQERS